MSDLSGGAASGQLSEEDSARAGFYALIGRLFYDAPDANLLAELCGSGEGVEDSGALVQAWKALHTACKNAYPAIVRQEYESLFVGVGKAPVTPYTSRYVSDTAADKHLVKLRQELASWGLQRRESVFEVEDHLSGLCDVMRFLIEQNRPFAQQRSFFEQFVLPGGMPLCDAVAAAPSAVFYKHVARFARAFFDVEKAAFEMADGT